MEQTYRIPESNWPRLQDRITRLNKRATKLRTPPVTASVAREERVPVVVLELGYDSVPREVERPEGPQPGETVAFYHTYLHVQVTGEAPKINGWTFAGTLQHIHDDKTVEAILRTVPGESLPERFRTAEPWCDHCRTRRFRRDTYIVRNDSGEYRQVGSDCLRDFLGHASPESLAEAAQSLANLHHDLEGMAGGGWHGDIRQIDIYHYMDLVALCVRQYGWVSRKRAQAEGTNATADAARELLDPVTARRERALPTEEDKQLASAALDWARSLSAETHPRFNDGDYLWNLRTACAADVAEHRTLGIIASAVRSYLREQEKLVEARRQAEGVKDEHFGTPGKREVFHLRFQDSRDMGGEDTLYGGYSIYKFADTEGRQAVLFSGTRFDFVKDVVYDVKATVKRHDRRNGLAQTVLTRLSVVPSPEEAARIKEERAKDRAQRKQATEITKTLMEKDPTLGYATANYKAWEIIREEGTNE